MYSLDPQAWPSNKEASLQESSNKLTEKRVQGRETSINTIDESLLYQRATAARDVYSPESIPLCTYTHDATATQQANMHSMYMHQTISDLLRLFLAQFWIKYQELDGLLQNVVLLLSSSTRLAIDILIITTCVPASATLFHLHSTAFSSVEWRLGTRLSHCRAAYVRLFLVAQLKIAHHVSLVLTGDSRVTVTQGL